MISLRMDKSDQNKRRITCRENTRVNLLFAAKFSEAHFFTLNGPDAEG